MTRSQSGESGDHRWYTTWSTDTGVHAGQIRQQLEPEVRVVVERAS